MLETGTPERDGGPPGRGPRLKRRAVPTLPQWRQAWRGRQAMLLSCAFHIVTLTTLAVLWTGGSGGTRGSQDRPVGIAVVTQVNGEESYFLTEGGASTLGSEASSAAAAEAAAALPSSEVSPLDADQLLAGLLPSSGGADGNVGEAAGGLGLGDGAPTLGGSLEIPKVKTSLFGVEGTGTRFVYVFDRSDSMNGYGGLPFRAAKQELLQSLQSLGRVHQFQVIFYNDSPLPYGGVSRGGVKLHTGSDENKKSVIDFVRRTGATGGTEHLTALRMGLEAGPDVLFFLTDADHPSLSTRQVEDLHTRAGRAGATIHTIQFGAGPNRNSGSWISQLATGSGGQYRYVDVTQLPRNATTGNATTGNATTGNAATGNAATGNASLSPGAGD
jgi:hypothetical protein